MFCRDCMSSYFFRNKRCKQKCCCLTSSNELHQIPMKIINLLNYYIFLSCGIIMWLKSFEFFLRNLTCFSLILDSCFRKQTTHLFLFSSSLTINHRLTPQWLLHHWEIHVRPIVSPMFHVDIISNLKYNISVWVGRWGLFSLNSYRIVLKISNIDSY